MELFTFIIYFYFSFFKNQEQYPAPWKNHQDSFEYSDDN